MVLSHSKGKFVLNRKIQNMGASNLKKQVKSCWNQSSIGFVNNHEATVWNTAFCCFHFWELPTRKAHPRHFKTKAPRKKTHKTHRDPRRITEKVPFQLVATLGYMFSIVGWLLVGLLTPSRPSPLNIILLTPCYFIVRVLFLFQCFVY